MSDIRIIEAPSVYLLGRQSVDDAELARFLADNGSPGWTTDAPSAGEALCEIAGRNCYQSFKNPRPGGSRAYLAHILDVAHGSVLEHAYFNLIITGVSRTLTHELIRHRAGFAYSELSQRYVDAEDFGFVVPPLYIEGVTFFEAWEKQEEFADRYHSLVTMYRDRGDEVADAIFDTGRIWTEEVREAIAAYRRLAESSEHLPAIAAIKDKTARRKAAREAARSVLPGCTETKIFVSANARGLRHLLEMRGSEHADAEICRLALALLPVLQAASPHLFGDYTIVQVDGVDTIQTPHRKV